MAGPNPASNSSMDDSLLTLVTRYSNCTQEFRYMDGNIYNPASAPFISTYLTDGSASTACSSTFNGTYPTPKTLAIKSLINGGVVAVVGWAGYKLPDSSLPFANLSQGLQVFYWDGYNNTAPVLVTPDILTQPNIEVSDIAISRNGKVVVVR